MISHSLKNTVGGAIGNAIEWYDFAVYGFIVPLISPLFFPHSEHPLISAYALFAVGFFSRPFGSFIFGYIGDRLGRKTVLKITVLLMSLPTFLIGILPTYHTIGIAAPIILGTLRFLQGLAMGGEFTSSAIYLVEKAPPNHQVIYGSFAYMCTTFGILLGSAAVTQIHLFFDTNTLLNWAWRLPFLIAILLGMFGYYLRYDLAESYEFTQTQVVQNPIVTTFKYHWIEMIKTCALNGFNAIGLYTFFIFSVVFLLDFVNVDTHFTYTLNTISLVILILTMPLGGYLADRLNNKIILFIGAVGILFLVYPFFYLTSAEHMTRTACIIFATAISFGLVQGCLPTTFVKIFSTHVRASGLAISFNISNALIGGTAPMFAVWLIRTTESYVPLIIYITTLLVIFLFTVIFWLKPISSK